MRDKWCVSGFKRCCVRTSCVRFHAAVWLSVFAAFTGVSIAAEPPPAKDSQHYPDSFYCETDYEISDSDEEAEQEAAADADEPDLSLDLDDTFQDPCDIDPNDLIPPLFGPWQQHYQVWSGIEATGNAVSTYAGITAAPFGSIKKDGLRLRFSSGIARYTYKTDAMIFGRLEKQWIMGDATFGDLLLGYQKQIGPATLKAFIGASFSDHILEPGDSKNPVSGQSYGAKSSLEVWFNHSDRIWSAANLNYTTAHHAFTGQVKLGYTINKRFALGLFAGAYGNAEFTGGRGGGLVRFTWISTEIALSGGLSGDIAKPSNPFVSLNVSGKF